MAEKRGAFRRKPPLVSFHPERALTIAVQGSTTIFKDSTIRYRSDRQDFFSSRKTGN